MAICIECCSPVSQLYTIHRQADDRVAGKGFQLTQCKRCHRFADKYVEHDFVVLFIDLLLIKPQVYRHLLFNRLCEATDTKWDYDDNDENGNRLTRDKEEVRRKYGGTDKNVSSKKNVRERWSRHLGLSKPLLNPSIIRLAVLLVLFDVYLTWARIEQATTLATKATATGSSLPVPHFSKQPLILQYLYFLLLCFLNTLAFHLPVRYMCSRFPWLVHRKGKMKQDNSNCTHKQIKSRHDLPPANLISTALIVSSCSKLFPLLLMIWDYDLPSSASAVSWAVIVNNIAALQIVLDCSYWRAALLLIIAASFRALTAWILLRMAGLSVIVSAVKHTNPFFISSLTPSVKSTYLKSATISVPINASCPEPDAIYTDYAFSVFLEYLTRFYTKYNLSSIANSYNNPPWISHFIQTIDETRLWIFRFW